MPKVALSKFHMPKFQLTKFHMPKVLYAEIPIAQMPYSLNTCIHSGSENMSATHVDTAQQTNQICIVMMKNISIVND